MPAAFRDSKLLTGKALGVTYLRENATESYVSIPPALIITEANGATWTLGMERCRDWEDGTGLEFIVIRNDIETGEFASRIEQCGRMVRIFGHFNGRPGWKTWNENMKYFF